MKTKRSKQPRWTAIATTTIEDPRVDTTKLPKGKLPPKVIVTQLLDEHGQHWERWGSEEPVMVRTPAGRNAGRR